MGRWMRAEKKDEAGMGRQRGFMCHSEPSLTSAGPKSEWRDVEDIRGGGCVGGGGVRGPRNSWRFSKANSQKSFD